MGEIHPDRDNDRSVDWGSGSYELGITVAYLAYGGVGSEEV